ncbi:MAG: esterase [Chloroflexi bacterium]|nr:esterase [Chloroflexota bacterium]MCC6892290.1 esterase [Anaerolineae bacterium]
MRLNGRVDTPYLQSQILQGNLPGDPTERMLPVYLPPGYDDNPDKRYPVIYVLAGHGGSGPLMLAPVAWGESFPERIDRLISTGAMQPVIAVLPDCWTIFGGAQYINSSALGQYEDYLLQELIPYVDSTYRTLASREHRAITGKSSGGYGAMVQSMRHPEVFGAMASHSGDIYFEFGLLPDLAKMHANLLRYNGLEGFIEQIPTIKPKSHDPFFSLLGMLCYGAAYAPNPAAHRGFDMPVDLETGALVEDVWQRWLAWDPVRMIDQAEHIDAWRQLSYIYLDCGLWDELNFPVGTRIMSNKLKALGIAHDFELFNDGHINVPYRYDVSLPRLEKAIRQK